QLCQVSDDHFAGARRRGSVRRRASGPVAVSRNFRTAGCSASTPPAMIICVSDEQRDSDIGEGDIGEGDVGEGDIRHVMFDADGVLQELPGGWVTAAEPYFGERTMEFLQRSYTAHLPALAGQGDHMVILAGILAEFGVTAPLEDIFRDIWLAA